MSFILRNIEAKKAREVKEKAIEAQEIANEYAINELLDHVSAHYDQTNAIQYQLDNFEQRGMNMLGAIVKHNEHIFASNDE